MDRWWIYIIDRKGKFYVGVTTDLENRMRQHGNAVPIYKEGPVSKQYALKREKKLKGWTREKNWGL